MENPFSQLLSRFELEAWMLWAFLALFLVFYAIVSVILFYHWRKYGRSNAAIVFAELIFFLGTGLFVYTALLGLLIFSA